MSTDQSPLLNGNMGNENRLKRDLTEMGVFDRRMAVYLLYRMRSFSSMGFSGFEGRHYSLFESFKKDMGHAVNLQTLITALAFKYILDGKISHAHIPDDPTTESERRQIFFGAAIGLPTFFVRSDTDNLMLKRLLSHTGKTRLSRRYSGYLRVYHTEYRKALLEVMLRDAADLIDLLGYGDTMSDLDERISSGGREGAMGRLIDGILGDGKRVTPMGCDAREFNLAAEHYYRNGLKKKHMDEAIGVLKEDLALLDKQFHELSPGMKSAMSSVLDGEGASEFLSRRKDALLDDNIENSSLIKLINLTILSIHADMERINGFMDEEQEKKAYKAA